MTKAFKLMTAQESKGFTAPCVKKKKNSTKYSGGYLLFPGAVITVV